jgi:hypothetical protein
VARRVKAEYRRMREEVASLAVESMGRVLGSGTPRSSHGPLALDERLGLTPHCRRRPGG